MARTPTYVTTKELSDIMKEVQKQLKVLSKDLLTLTKKFDKVNAPKSKKTSKSESFTVPCVN